MDVVPLAIGLHLDPQAEMAEEDARGAATRAGPSGRPPSGQLPRGVKAFVTRRIPLGLCSCVTRTPVSGS
jgi:hypothetical protein